MTWRYRMHGVMHAPERRAYIWLGSLGPLLWAVTAGDWEWAECLPKGWE